MKVDRNLQIRYSDTEYGCKRFGFIPRVTTTNPKEDDEMSLDEDTRYERYVERKHGHKVRISRYGIVQIL